MRTTKSVTISLPPAQLKAAERLAKKESRTMSELFREALRSYEQKQEQFRPSPSVLAELGSVVRLIRQDAKAAGLDKMTMREINAEVSAARKARGTKTSKPTKRSGK